jgi:protoporphyrinogen oxidase
MQVLIIGAGLTGLSAAYALEQAGLDYVIVEKEAKVGGLCSSSLTKEGFTFDTTGHLLHLRNVWVKNLVEDLLRRMGTTLIKHSREAMVYFKGQCIPYPFQSYFYLLNNKRVVKECIDGIKKSLDGQRKVPRNFEQYIEYYLGHGIAKHFMIPYNRKLWTLPPSRLSQEWADRFVPRPNLNEILLMAAKGTIPDRISKEKWGYNPHFWYPDRGGIQSVTNAISGCLRKGKLKMNCDVKTIDIEHKQVLSGDGETFDYDVLISTIALPDLLARIRVVPTSCRETAGKLRYVSILNSNFGIDKEIETNTHWIYFPQSNIVFHRVGFPSALSPFMAPRGSSSVSVEVSYSRFKPLGDKRTIKQRIIRTLMKIGLIRSRNEIISELDNDVKYAYVIYDRNYSTNRGLAHALLSKHGIHSIGRFGSWVYSSMEDDIIEGYEIARRLGNDR